MSSESRLSPNILCKESRIESKYQVAPNLRLVAPRHPVSLYGVTMHVILVSPNLQSRRRYTPPPSPSIEVPVEIRNSKVCYNIKYPVRI